MMCSSSSSSSSSDSSSSSSLSRFPSFACSCLSMSNERLLFVNLVCFAVFVLAELVGAYLSNSLSLIGDATAMSVDVFTYIGNIVVEFARESESGRRESKNFVSTQVLGTAIDLSSSCSHTHALSLSIYL